MVPVKLHLRNFMCYRGSDNLIDLSGIHLACLAGDNGQGKSAILDAITWALWGRARTRRDDDLITYGETEMEVQLEFDLNNERFRVIRQRSSAGRGSSTLELQGRTAGGFFASLSEATIRESQKRINDVLRLDYDTFVNSAFLLQGRADEFTTKRPAERKQILGEILSLAEYDEYAERAKKRSRDAEARRVQAERELESIRAIVAGIPEIEEELVNAEALAHALEHELRAANNDLQLLFDQRREMDARAEALTQTERRAQEHRGEAARLKARLEDVQAKATRYDDLLARADEIQATMQQLERARAEKERWDDLLQQTLHLREQTGGLQREVDAARSALQGEIKGVDGNIRTHQSTIKRFINRERELEETQRQVQLLEQTQQEREHNQELLGQWKEVMGRLAAENTALRDAMHDLKERMNLLAGSDHADCPVCRQPLSAEARRDALARAESEGKGMGDSYRQNQSEIKRAQEEVAGLEQRVRSAGKQLKALDEWQRRRAEAVQASQEARHARELLAAAEQERAGLQARLEASDYAREAQAELAELATAEASLGYDRARHDQAKQTIQRLSPRQSEFNELLIARESRAQIDDTIRSFQENVKHVQEKIAACEHEISVLAVQLREREALQRNIHEQQVVVNNLQRDRTNAERGLGGARQRLAYAEQHAARQPEVEATHTGAVQERAIYEQLVQAFGKRGLQAMIIESALPEIEEEANALLGRMTDGRMSVALLTQREARSGDPIETLDIVIMDDNGERPYETFSGGEAFRVNFALRIALSKLLAHRAGASLRTLVMDEGFGSQDAQGRERLVEAITSVQDDFDRIIVITHIEELKDAFPVRIDVVKGPQGSRVRVQ